MPGGSGYSLLPDGRELVAYAHDVANRDETDASEGLGIPSDELRRFAQAFSTLADEVHTLAERGVSELAQRLAAHLGASPGDLSVLAQEVPAYQLVDVQVALDRWATEIADRSIEVIGVSGAHRHFESLSDLVAEGTGARVGSVDYVDMPDSPDSTRSCVRFGIFLMGEGPQRAAALLRGASPHGPMQEAMIEVIAPEPDFGRAILAELRGLAVEFSVLRGQVLTIGPGEGHQYGDLRFMHRPHLEREQLVLPEVTLERIERHVISIAAESIRLKAAGQHLKRGVLLYGPPGTGKTHTVRYLLSRQRDVTAFVLSGQALALVAQVCGLARLLQPSIVILEDIDLIAPDRSFGPLGTSPLLFEVLNQIDGLDDDVDVTFLLTTNRVDILERALAERPGRVDAAVEIGPPDSIGRARLFRLYGGEVALGDMSDEELAGAVEATEGRTATYIREVVRRAVMATAAIQEAGPLRVDGAALIEAATGLAEDHVVLSRSLFGGDEEPDAGAMLAGRPPWGPVNVARIMRGGGWVGYAPRGGSPRPFGPDQ